MDNNKYFSVRTSSSTSPLPGSHLYKKITNQPKRLDMKKNMYLTKNLNQDIILFLRFQKEKSEVAAWIKGVVNCEGDRFYLMMFLGFIDIKT